MGSVVEELGFYLWDRESCGSERRKLSFLEQVFVAPL